MQAPQAPIDIKIALGSQEGCHNLINVDIDFSDNKEHVKQHLQQKKITKDFGKDCVLFFDLYTQSGKQKQAIQYFSQENGKSPLQIVFRARPQPQQQNIKFQIQQHQGFIRIIYTFIVQTQNQDIIQQLNQILQIFENNSLHLQSHINFEIKGIISHNNKNRTNVKVDYAKFHLISNAFNSQCLLNSLTSIQGFAQEISDIINNPFFQLVKKSKLAKINIKMESFRKINKYYNQVNQQNKISETKQFKYINKGIFRQRVNGTMIYNNQYLIKVQGKYQSEDVFIRLIKVYSKFFEQILDTAFYNDD